jgi:hypothetical protein
VDGIGGKGDFLLHFIIISRKYFCGLRVVEKNIFRGETFACG